MKRAAVLLSPLFLVYVAAMLLLPAREGWAGDEPEYLNLADNIVHGFYREGTSDGALNMCFPGWQTPDLWYGPAYPVFLAPLVALGLPVSVIRLVGPVLLLLSVLLFYRLLLLTVRPAVALAGAFGLGVFVPFYRYLPFLHSEFLALVLVIVSMIAITLLLRSGSRLALAAASTSLAGLALTRVAYGWVLTLLALIWLIVWLIGRSGRARRLTLVHGLALACCIPWLAFTYSVTERPALWGTSGGLSLYWMSSPYAADLGDWHCASDVFAEASLTPHRTFFREHQRDTPSEQNRALERRALTNVLEHPGKYATNLAANASRMIFNAPYSRRGLDARTVVIALSGAILLVLFVAALARLMRAQRPLAPEVAAFGLFLAISFAVHLPVSAYARMLIPMVPAIVWLIAYGLGRDDRTDKRP